MTEILKYENCDITLMISALNGAFTLDQAVFYGRRAAEYLKICEKEIVELSNKLLELEEAEFARNEMNL